MSPGSVYGGWISPVPRWGISGVAAGGRADGEGPATVGGGAFPYSLNVGGDLLSHTLPGAVPSALEGLASGFGMGPGVPPPPQPPTTQSTNQFLRLIPMVSGVVVCSGSHSGCEQSRVCGVSPRPISTGRLHPSQGFHLQPINPIICGGPYPRPQAGWWETSSWNELPA